MARLIANLLGHPEGARGSTVSPNETMPRWNIWESLFCGHQRRERKGWIDDSSGPGWMADAYEADFCIHCGHMTNKEQTY